MEGNYFFWFVFIGGAATAFALWIANQGLPMTRCSWRSHRKYHPAYTLKPTMHRK